MEEDEIQKETISTYQPPGSPVLSTSPGPPSSKMAYLNLNNPPPQPPNVDSSSLRLSLNLSVSPPPPDQKSPPARHSSGFQGMSGNFKNTGSSSSGDSIISVA